MNDARAIALYAECREARHRVKHKPPLASFVRLPAPSMLSAFSLEHFVTRADQDLQDLANFANSLSYHLLSLQSWALVLEGLSDSDRHSVVVEFINPLAYLCLGVPYAFKGRMHYSIAAVSHLANECVISGWEYVDDLGPSKYETARQQAGDWYGWPRLRGCLGRVDDKAYRKASKGFRNHFHHGRPGLVEFGVRPVTHRTDDGAGLALGIEEAIPLADIIQALLPQASAIVSAHAAYVDLIVEQYAVVNG